MTSLFLCSFLHVSTWTLKVNLLTASVVVFWLNLVSEATSILHLSECKLTLYYYFIILFFLRYFTIDLKLFCINTLSPFLYWIQKQFDSINRYFDVFVEGVCDIQWWFVSNLQMTGFSYTSKWSLGVSRVGSICVIYRGGFLFLDLKKVLELLK